MKLTKNKKGLGFDTINAGLISFVTFVMIVLLTIVLISQTTHTSMVCSSYTNHTVTWYNGACWDCKFNGTQAAVYNTTDQLCYNGTEKMTTANAALQEYNDTAYLAMKDMRDAARLPATFSSVMMITTIIIGILSLLAMVGYGIYRRMNR